MMKVGDIAEIGYWCRGEFEQPIAKKRMRERLDKSACEANVRLSEPIFTRHEVGGERTPPVPKSIQGPDVHFLAAEAKVVGIVTTKVKTFIEDLSRKDLERLRSATRRAYMRQYGPLAEPLCDEACDVAIEAMGPKIAEAMLSKKINATEH